MSICGPSSRGCVTSQLEREGQSLSVFSTSAHLLETPLRVLNVSLLCCCNLSKNTTWLSAHASPLRVCMLSRFSHVWLFATPWTVAHQAPLSMGFSRQEYWSGLSGPGLNLSLLCLLHWEVGSLPPCHLGGLHHTYYTSKVKYNRGKKNPVKLLFCEKILQGWISEEKPELVTAPTAWSPGQVACYIPCLGTKKCQRKGCWSCSETPEQVFFGG